MSASVQHPSTSRKQLLLLRGAALVGPIAAAVIVAIAAVARAADVSLEVDGKAIPLAAFAFWTIAATLAGSVVAILARHRRRFLTIALTGLAVSFVPPIVAADDTTTALVLVATHLAAAAIIIPALARHLARRGSR